MLLNIYIHLFIMVKHNDICFTVFVGSAKKNLPTSVLISTKQAPGWKAILVSSFPLDTQANGILLSKYVPKLFFHQSGDLKPVGRERRGFHLQASMVVGLGTVPYARNLATTDKIVQTLRPTNNQMLQTHSQTHNQIHNRLDVVSASHVDKRDTTSGRVQHGHMITLRIQTLMLNEVYS